MKEMRKNLLFEKYQRSELLLSELLELLELSETAINKLLLIALIL